MDSFALRLPTGFPMDVLEIMKREPKICNYLDIPLQHISDSILKSMRRGTTQAKTTKFKRIPCSCSGYSNYFNSRISGETQEDFNLERFCSRNEI
jgi:ribosomal protein S12 methylthiotransferase